MNTIFLIAHLIGIALGAGGAYMSDVLFFHDRSIPTLKLASRVVWIGLAIIVLSGIGLFSLNAAGYLHSAKFLLKMTVVLVIAINGYVFHRVHMPKLEQGIFTRGLAVSGAISITSWTLAIILGALSHISVSYLFGLGLYVLLLLCASLGAVLMYPRLVKTLPDQT